MTILNCADYNQREFAGRYGEVYVPLSDGLTLPMYGEDGMMPEWEPRTLTNEELAEVERDGQKVLYVDDVSKAKALEALAKREESGIISGALNPNSSRAKAHAQRYYQSVRAMATDAQRISDNTGYSVDVIKRIKNFIFVDEHDLGNGRVSRFDASFEMAQSWQRLIDGKNIQPHDLTLLRHEMMEKGLMDAGYTQDEAHIMTSQVYNYAKEAYEYYYG